MILNGQQAAAEIQEELKKKVATLKRPPGLAAILLGEHPSSSTYVNTKKKAAEKIGIDSRLYHLEANAPEQKILDLIHELNHDSKIDGILVQLPLPPHVKPSLIFDGIDINKDVDGFHPTNQGKLLLGRTDGIIPCTPLGIKFLLEKYQIPVEGKHVVIAGRSNIVGKPLAALMMQNHSGANATVTIIHSKTKNFSHYTAEADILVAAIGVPRLITAEMVKKGAVVIDVGINRIADPLLPQGYRIVGDVDFESVEQKCSAITPVPKGIGPMTVSMLLHNTLLCYERRYFSSSY